MKRHKFSHTKDRIFKAVLKVANHLDLSIEDKSYEDGYIQLFCSGNLLSFGNRIVIEIVSENPEKCLVDISSKSVMQVLDWGTNAKLESDVLETLIEILQR